MPPPAARRRSGIHPRHSSLSNAHGDAEIDVIEPGYDRALRALRAAA
jgi:hypothetical protein